MSLTELLLFAGSSLKDFNWKYRETVEKRRKENIKEINSEVDLDGRSVGRGNSAAGLLGREDESGPIMAEKRCSVPRPSNLCGDP